MAYHSEVVVLNISKLSWDAQGMGRRATVSQARIRTSDSSWRTGVFCLTPITAGDTVIPSVL